MCIRDRSDVIVEIAENDSIFTLDADDIDGDDLTISFVPMDNGTFFGGSIAHNEDGSFTYSMGTNASDQDFVLYKATDEISESSLGLITFNISGGTMFAGRGAPLALTDEVAVTEDIIKTISFVGFDADNAFSEDAFVTITEHPSNGTIDYEFILIVDGVDELAQWTLTYTPDPDFSGTDEIKFTINNPSNPEGESEEATISITVNAVNDLPTISAIEDATINEDESLTLIVDAADADNDLILSHISSDANFVTSIENSVLLVTPNPNYSGTATITVTATEDGSENAQTSESFNVVVASVNDSPQMTSIEDQITSEDEIFSLILSANDVEGDEFTFSELSTPDWLNIDGATLSGTPLNEDVGDQIISVAVSDASASDTVSFVLTVENVNDAPDIDVLSYPGTVDEDTEKTFQFIPQDVDADDTTLSVIVTSLDMNLVPSDSIIIEPTGPYMSGDTVTVTLKTKLDQFGTTSIILEVMDDDLAIVSRDLVFTVNNVNDAPVVAEVGDQQTWEDQALQITLNVTDPENDYDDITIWADILENEDILNLNTSVNNVLTDNVLILTPVPNAVGVATIWVFADDGEPENSDSDTMYFDLTIMDVNDLPTITGLSEGGEMTGLEDAEQELFITPLDDDPQDNLTLSITTDNPALFPEGSITIDPLTALSNVDRQIIFDPGANQYGSAVVMISVSDGSETITEQILYTVISVPDAPIITPVSAHSTVQGELYSITVIAMDPEGDEFTFELVNDGFTPEDMEIDSLSGVITWTPTIDDVSIDPYSVTVSVEDDLFYDSQMTYELSLIHI